MTTPPFCVGCKGRFRGRGESASPRRRPEPPSRGARVEPARSVWSFTRRNRFHSPPEPSSRRTIRREAGTYPTCCIMQQDSFRGLEFFQKCCERSRGRVGRGGRFRPTLPRRSLDPRRLSRRPWAALSGAAMNPKPVAAANARFGEIRDRVTAFAVVCIKDDEPGLCTADAKSPTGNRRLRLSLCSNQLSYFKLALEGGTRTRDRRVNEGIVSYAAIGTRLRRSGTRRIGACVAQRNIKICDALLFLQTDHAQYRFLPPEGEGGAKRRIGV